MLCFGTLFSFFIYLFIPLFLGFCPTSSGLRLSLATIVRVPLLFLYDSQFSMVFVPGFQNPTPLAALRFDSPPVLSVLRVLLGYPSVVRVLLHCISAGFLSYSDHSLLRVPPCPSCCLSALWDCFSLCLLGVFFAPALFLSPPGLPCSVAVASGYRFYDSFESPVPVAMWSAFGLCFLGSSGLPLLFSFSICLHSVPLPCLQLAFSACRVHQMGSVGFFLVLGLLRCWFFPGPFVVPTLADSFHPSASTLVFFGLRFPSHQGLPFGRVPGSS